jgi:hypothetical protein
VGVGIGMYEDRPFLIGFCLEIGLGTYVGMGSNWDFRLDSGNKVAANG